MKKIDAINTYLLERYPNIWNTKIVWILLINVVLHSLFFFLGYFSNNHVKALQSYDLVSNFFTNGYILIQVILFVLLMVGWLVLMFKNNAFKNFYPMSRAQLFGQFIQYFIIIFTSVTYYFSYMYGMKTIINQKYDEVTMHERIQKVNLGAAFLSTSIDHYTLNNIRYPEVFENSFCETNTDRMIPGDKVFHFLNQAYQFHTIKSYAAKRNPSSECLWPNFNGNTTHRLAYLNHFDCTYFLKEKAIDVLQYVKTTQPSYYNYSEVFYDYEQITSYYANRNGYYNENGDYYENLKTNEKNYAINKSVAQLLDRNNPEEIKKTLTDFLDVASEFKIDTNLTPENWFTLMYHPKAFEVERFILRDKYDYKSAVASQNPDADAAVIEIDSTVHSYAGKDAAIAGNYNVNADFYRNRISNYYFATQDLLQALKNIDEVKSVTIFSNNILVVLWISFGLALFIFSYRITNLKAVLFSIVTFGVLCLLFGMLGMIMGLYRTSYNEFVLMALASLIYLFALFSTLLFMKQGKKLYYSILLLIALNGWVFFVLLFINIIDFIQRKVCPDDSCVNLSDYLSDFLHLILLVSGFLFLWAYVTVIKKWRSAPE